MLRRCALAAGGLVAAFHVWLLAAQVWSGHAAQPDVLLRWLVAGALVAGLIALGRRGLPVVLGRHAVAVWLLAALLHGPALASDLDGFATPALPEAVATAIQAAASIVASGAVLLFLLRHSAWALATTAGLVAPRGTWTSRSRSATRQTRFLPRPPPLL